MRSKRQVGTATVMATQQKSGYGAAILLSSLLVWTLFSTPAAAQSEAARPQTIVRSGDACQRKSDSRPGVVRIDGCGRVYCGKPDVKSLVEVRPTIADELNCTWRLEGNACRCRPNPSGSKGR